MSGTLISILEGFFYYFIVIICFSLSISWIYCLSRGNRIPQLNSSKLPHYFFSLLIEWNIWLVSRFISKKLKWPLRFIPARPSWKGNPQAKHITRVDRTSVGEMKWINEFFSSRVKRKEGKVKSKDMMSLNKCFIVLTVSSRKGTNSENNVLRRPFTKEITVYKVTHKFSLSNVQNTTFNLLEFEIERNDR